MSELPDVAGRVSEGSIDALLVGLGVANRAVATALLARGHTVVATDDRPDAAVVAAAAEADVELVVGPTKADLTALVDRTDVVFPTPGLPEWHPVLTTAESRGVAVGGEFDLARAWDARPLAAVTGTNGKTTVVELSVAALNASGIRAMAAGNTDVPLVAAIDDERTEVFVVEASSFRLGHAQRFSPQVATWLNFAPDHLDVHRDLESYERAKASLWADLEDGAVAVANATDPVVMRNIPRDRVVRTFGRETSDWRVESDRLVGPDGDIIAVADLWRTMPHDVEDALAAAATVAVVGASPSGIADAYRSFRLPAHRVQLVGEIDGIEFYDDSKATTPHATVAALRGFERAVLIAGGSRKGISLAPMLEAVDQIHAVVAIGESPEEIKAVFENRRDVHTAADMDEAVAVALEQAPADTVVLLSPGCASFDWYEGYSERGDDFVRAVNEQTNRRAVQGGR